MGAGRPSKFDSINKDQMKKLYLAGWTDLEVADFFSISRATITNWKSSNPEFLSTIKEWKEAGDNRVERSLYERAIGYDYPEEKVFLKPTTIKTTDKNGKVTEKTTHEVVRVAVRKHQPANVTAQIYWTTNRKPKDWKRTRQEQASDPLAAKIYELMTKRNGNGNGKAKKDKRFDTDEQNKDQDNQTEVIERTVIIQQIKGVEVVE